MSLKPVKKSDQNKSWMQPRRDRRKMIQPEYHLIVTEGTETEILKSLGEGEYRKNRDDMYRILYPHMNDAIVNAKKLEIINEGKTPSKSAPGTMIHKLVEKLEPYLTAKK